jgi:transposase InsO family protein
MLIIKRKQRYRVITNSDHNERVSENQVKRKLPEHIFEILVSDITYLRTREKEYYLTVIMDLYARMILSYCLTNNLGSGGLIKAFLMIAEKYKEKLKGCIFHSDRGTQFCSRTFHQLAEDYGLILSNSRKGNPYDNACMERLFATLKNEYMLKVIFPDLASMIRAVKDAVFSYNNKRLHMSLNLRTPKQQFLEDLKSY